jgi:hypothetical protein
VIRTRPVLVALTAFATLTALGCGGGSDSSNSTASTSSSQAAVGPTPALERQALTRAKRATARLVQRTPDKNVPGPKRYKAVCIHSDDPSAGPDVPPNGLKCHVNAYFKAYRGKPAGYIWGDAWLFRIDAKGRLSAPAPDGADPLRNYMREDNRRNCTGRHRPAECVPESLGGVLPG